MLIQRLLSRFPINYVGCYHFAKYTFRDTNVKVVSLLLELDFREGYYDVIYNHYVDVKSVEFKKPLTTYVNINKSCISNAKAKRLSTPYLKRFENKCKKTEYKLANKTYPHYVNTYICDL